MSTKTDVLPSQCADAGAMTMPARPASGAGRRAPINLVAVMGFLLIGVIDLFPMNDVSLYVGLTRYSRWGFTDVIFAAAVLVAAIWLFNQGVAARIPLYFITLSALAIIGSECYFVYYAFHNLIGDNYVSSAIDFLGYWVILIAAVAGIVSSLLPPRATSRQPRPAPISSLGQPSSIVDLQRTSRIADQQSASRDVSLWEGY